MLLVAFVYLAPCPALLVNAARPQRLRFMPALNLQAGEVELALALLAEACA